MMGPFILSVIAGATFVIFLRYGWFLLTVTINGLSRARPTRYSPAARPEDEHVQILVLGDIGRSPRMQYHAISLVKMGRKVDLIGYKETARHPELIGKPNVELHALTPTPEWITWGNLPFFLTIPCKVIIQFWTLWSTLAYKTEPARWIILQNPPSIPTFHVALIIAWLRGSKVLVDWHNYGHTLLATGSALKKPLVPIYKRYETFLGRYLGDANLAVTDAMAEQLREPPFKISSPVYTLHDRPAEIFQPILSKEARLAFLTKLAETKSDAKNIVEGNVRLLVSSTSWTPDEDFQILLDALVEYANPQADDTKPEGEPPSPILAIITGKGPQKDHYIAKIKELQEQGSLPGVRVLTAWLSNRDYASLLASADLGISLHKSSSGVDLPMKVVDMFGAGLPVAAYSAFESFGELVKEGENGRGFETAGELAAIFRTLLSMSGAKTLAGLKEGAVREGSLRWDEEWNRVVKPIVEGS
ncbi:hypothetical protein NLU13_0699 [Sarocladium strictum]|uniref:Chitobiosyldiphosphodolichol beta-mannosyltransferase n=1 Tax=Sarocladium strictum TaxID=5046 RepID=A0AA39GR01_SARSR|nr:hypothetical protein NLU13_0699 [Sarocladium strictum]